MLVLVTRGLVIGLVVGGAVADTLRLGIVGGSVVGGVVGGVGAGARDRDAGTQHEDDRGYGEEHEAAPSLHDPPVGVAGT